MLLSFLVQTWWGQSSSQICHQHRLPAHRLRSHLRKWTRNRLSSVRSHQGGYCEKGRVVRNQQVMEHHAQARLGRTGHQNNLEELAVRLPWLVPDPLAFCLKGKTQSLKSIVQPTDWFNRLIRKTPCPLHFRKKFHKIPFLSFRKKMLYFRLTQMAQQLTAMSTT